MKAHTAEKLLSLEMDLTGEIQTLAEAVCILFQINPLGKSINPSLFSIPKSLCK